MSTNCRASRRSAKSIAGRVPLPSPVAHASRWVFPMPDGPRPWRSSAVADREAARPFASTSSNGTSATDGGGGGETSWTGGTGGGGGETSWTGGTGGGGGETSWTGGTGGGWTSTTDGTGGGGTSRTGETGGSGTSSGSNRSLFEYVAAAGSADGSQFMLAGQALRNAQAWLAMLVPGPS